MNTPNSVSSWRDNSNLNDSLNDSNPLHLSTSDSNSPVSPSQQTPEEEKTVCRPPFNVWLRDSKLSPATNPVITPRRIFENTEEQCNHKSIMSALPDNFQLKYEPDEKVIIPISILAEQSPGTCNIGGPIDPPLPDLDSLGLLIPI